jgi:hypothetical protein
MITLMAMPMMKKPDKRPLSVDDGIVMSDGGEMMPIRMRGTRDAHRDPPRVTNARAVEHPNRRKC